jgi:hypothetical protein
MPKTFKVKLYEFNMGDVEDPYIHAAVPLSEWQQTESGQWAMAHCILQPVFVCHMNPEAWGYTVRITGELNETDYLYWQLKYGKYNNNQ